MSSNQMGSAPSIASPSERPKKSHPKKWWLLAICIAIIALAATGWVLRPKAQNLNDVSVVKVRISRHFVLPTDEQPALATVTDSSKLQSSFAGRVQNGDKILIYQRNKIAIAYRPSIDRIVDVEPVSIDSPPGATGNQ